MEYMHSSRSTTDRSMSYTSSIGSLSASHQNDRMYWQRRTSSMSRRSTDNDSVPTFLDQDSISEMHSSRFSDDLPSLVSLSDEEVADNVPTNSLGDEGMAFIEEQQRIWDEIKQKQQRANEEKSLESDHVMKEQQAAYDYWSEKRASFSSESLETSVDTREIPPNKMIPETREHNSMVAVRCVSCHQKMLAPTEAELVRCPRCTCVFHPSRTTLSEISSMKRRQSSTGLGRQNLNRKDSRNVQTRECEEALNRISTNQRPHSFSHILEFKMDQYAQLKTTR
mmetsp:Transcript_19048/g.28953  ORF Transcript_19048/g.28953 Transcript_19048/m.28953 type:complete len:281 (+) Transcript_19048:47-889(+)